MKVVSFNTRYPWKSDGINSFVHRAGMIYEKISEESPDVIAFQEVRQKSLVLPVVIFGDFNAEPTSKAIRLRRI